MKLLADYEKAKNALFDYFGYVEDWRILPIDYGAIECFWKTDDDNVTFAETIELLSDEPAGEYYTNEIYRQHHLPKWVYRGKDYTMIVVDTHCDGNQLLQIFDNSKEQN